jgi:hypothetical protein
VGRGAEPARTIDCSLREIIGAAFDRALALLTEHRAARPSRPGARTA